MRFLQDANLVRRIRVYSGPAHALLVLPRDVSSPLVSIRDLRIIEMHAVFVELPAFDRHRSSYLDDEGFRALQHLLMHHPDLGDVMPETGGLRKLRVLDRRRRRGSRGGLRVIYFWWPEGQQFWLFTLYAKGEVSDLTPKQRAMFRAWLKAELGARKGP